MSGLITFEIVKNRPVPDKRIERVQRYAYPFAQMAPGDMFVCPPETMYSMRGALCSYHKTHPGALFKTYRIGHEFGVWCIHNAPLVRLRSGGERKQPTREATPMANASAKRIGRVVRKAAARTPTFFDQPKINMQALAQRARVVSLERED
jgi:hypothetical protein